MAESVSPKTGEIREYLLTNIQSARLAALAAAHFDISRQAINQHLRNLADEKLIRAEGETKDRSYRLVSRELLSKSYETEPQLEEDRIWAQDVAPVLQNLPKNVLGMWNFCFTEIFNNCIDHSEGSEISVYLISNALETELLIHDDGVGIFRKIQRAMGLADEREALLELVKGKFTTDRARHSGLGVFFSSRMVDSFDISSGEVHFHHEHGKMHDAVFETDEILPGTSVLMRLSNKSTRSTSETFEKFGEGVPLNFNKTVIPLALAQHANEFLVSRSQAKRILARADQFEHVVFDFDEVTTIGQGFADEIFRVFANAHPTLKLTTMRTTPEVQQMIDAIKKEAQRQLKFDHRATAIAER